MRIIDLIWRELETPSGEIGPLTGAYQRAAGGVWHSVLGAVACESLDSVWGLSLALPLAAIYWLIKETGDLRRGGNVWDGAEDTIMVSLGAWYGVWWWPAMVCGAGLYLMASAAWRVK